MTEDAPSFDGLIAACGLPRIDARALAAHASGRTREWLAAHGDEAVAPAIAAQFRALARRRTAGEPPAYLLGWREFYGLRFAVSPAVLIPRPDTELLVRWAIEHAPPGARVLELGTGSGAIAVTLALQRPDLRVTATDLSADALAVAAGNRDRLMGAAAGRLTLLQGDWYAALPAEARFDVVVSNPPYIAADDPHLRQPDLACEPRGALTDGQDALDALRAIAAGARRVLVPDGCLACEHGWDQGAAVRALLTRAGLSGVHTLRDDEGRERVTFGCGRAPDAGADAEP